MPSGSKKIFDEPLHHAYLIEGERETLLGVEDNLHLLGYETIGHPDHYVFDYEFGFGIDDARELKRRHLAKPVAREKKIFLMWIPRITREAQNALLKVLEEPVGESVFFIVSPATKFFLPTILSRVEVVTDQKYVLNDKSLVVAREFLSSSAQDRLSLVEPIVKEKDKEQAREFLKAIEYLLSLKLPKQAEDSELMTSLKNVIKMERFLQGRSPSVKMILEHLALTLPIN